jgi:tetratricopeptide (TPR) repeat protein
LAQYAEAAQIYEAALKLDDRRSDWWGNLGDAYYWAPGKRERAAPAYQKAVSLANGELKVNPRNASLWGYLATYHAMLGDKQQALSCLEHALRLAPKESELLFNAALVHNQFLDTQETLKWLRKAVAAGYSATAVNDTPNFQNLRTNPRFVEMLKRP